MSIAAHAIKRCKERYGVDLTLKQLRAIERQVVQGEAFCVYPKTRRGGAVYLVTLPNGKKAPAVVMSDIIITFQPIERRKMVQRKKGGPRKPIHHQPVHGGH